MGIRKQLIAIAAVLGTVASMAFVVPSASADAATEPPDAFAVGGGASGLEIHVELDNEALFSSIGSYRDYGYELVDTRPRVILPDQGGPLQQQSVVRGAVTTAVTANVLKATTVGNLRGLPYAASTASAADVRIQTTNIRAVRAECNWDRSGATATTKIVDAAGKSYTPAPNTRIDLPGLGFAYLNEQGSDTDPYSGAVTIWVKAVHVFLFAETDPNNYDGLYSDISVGFASCDPLNLPSLSGLKLKSSTPSD
jgi:hypothetical protein